MPSVVPLPNPNFPTGPIPGMPGAAYQPTSGATFGMPGEAYLGQGFVPQAAPVAPPPVAETPVNMPSKRTLYEGPRAHQVAKQRWEKQQIRKWLGSQSARPPQPTMPSAPVNPSAGVPTPQVSSGYAPSSPTTGARVFVGGSSGPPTVLQDIPSPRGASTGPPTPGSPLTGPRFGPSAPIKSSMKVGPTNASPFPQMRAVGPKPFGGTQLNPSNLRPTGWGGYASRGMNALAPLGAGTMISGLGDQFDSDTLRAAGTGTSIFGTAAALGGAGALPATAVPAAGIGLGGALARPSTTRTAELGRFLESRNFDDLNFAEGDNLLEQGADAALDLSFAPLSGLLAGGSKALTSLFGGDTSDPNDNPALRGERGMDSLGLGFGGEDEGGGQQQVRQIVPTELPAIMSSLGLSPEIQQTALAQMNEDAQLRRIYAEQQIPFPGDVDEDGNPFLRDPAEIDSIVAQQFVQSLPELMDMEREQQAALSRAAMFQAAMGDVMGPYQDASNALADSYAGLLNVPGLAPELQGPMANYANALAAQTRGTANAYGAMSAAIPATIGLESYMQQQQALQAQMQQQLMQAQIDAMTDNAAAAGTEADILG